MTAIYSVISCYAERLLTVLRKSKCGVIEFINENEISEQLLVTTGIMSVFPFLLKVDWVMKTRDDVKLKDMEDWTLHHPKKTFNPQI